MTLLIGIMWLASLAGIAFSILSNQWIGVYIMMINFILATIMLLERIEK